MERGTSVSLISCMYVPISEASNLRSISSFNSAFSSEKKPERLQRTLLLQASSHFCHKTAASSSDAYLRDIIACLNNLWTSFCRTISNVGYKTVYATCTGTNNAQTNFRKAVRIAITEDTVDDVLLRVE